MTLGEWWDTCTRGELYDINVQGQVFRMKPCLVFNEKSGKPEGIIINNQMIPEIAVNIEAIKK